MFVALGRLFGGMGRMLFQRGNFRFKPDDPCPKWCEQSRLFLKDEGARRIMAFFVIDVIGSFSRFYICTNT